MPPTDQDHSFLRHSFRLAMNGRGQVEPNPMVGCVIVQNGQIIGDGWHESFGGPHAEPNALADCLRRGNSPRGATAYVTLEPCCHTDKKTPPCVPKLIEARIARVIIGCLDPNPLVNGKGIDKLRAAGIEVIAPVLEGEAKQLIAPFLARMHFGRPYVTLKWAETADGKVAGPAGKRMQISNTASSRLVHLLRARSDAIAVGINTVLCDDPLLTARGVKALRKTERCVLDSRLRIPLDCQLVRTARTIHTQVFCAESAMAANRTKIALLDEAGVVVAPLPQNHDGTLSLSHFCRAIGPASHLMIEPGPTLVSGFLRARLADRIWVIRSSNVVNDSSAPAAAAIPDHFVVSSERNVDGDRVTEYLNVKSEVFSAPFPSADMVLAP